MRALVAAALLVACASEPGAGRDYTLVACPTATDLGSVSPLEVCDLGVGATPRFVSVRDCAAMAGRDWSRVVDGSCAHPSAAVCASSFPRVFLCTYSDVAGATYR
jgi:hypothetical protein